MGLTKEQIIQIPKVELHRHLELSVRHTTLRELAPQFGIEIPNDKVFAERFLIQKPMKDLGSVLNKFLDTQLLWGSTEIIERLTYEICVDAYKEGIRVLELRYAPTFIRYRHDHLSFEKIHEAIVAGKTRAEKDFPMAVGLICIIQRILPVEEAERVTDFAIAHKDTFIALDIADNEDGFDSKPFAPFFARAKKAGLGVTAHAGEINVPKAPKYVRDAIDHLGATRIGHGIQIYRDPEMLSYVKEKNVVLEVCVKSNWLTQALPGDVGVHPIRKLIDAGVAVTINTDDPGIFDTDMVQEYELLVREFGFTEADFRRANDIAFEASFIPGHLKNKVWKNK